GLAPSVDTGPGATVLTRTPAGLNSAAQARDSAVRAALVASYAAPPARPTCPAIESTLTMLPCPLDAIPGAIAATSWYAERTLLAKSACSVGESRSAVGS